MRELAAELRAEVDRAAAFYRTLDDALVSRSRGDGKWLMKEILGHVIDSAANNQQRFVRAQLASALTWPEYDGDAWVRLHRYRERPWAELVDVWVALNRQVAAVIEGMPAEKLGTKCTIGENAPVSLEWLVRDYLRHLKHHLQQLQDAGATVGERP